MTKQFFKIEQLDSNLNLLASYYNSKSKIKIGRAEIFDALFIMLSDKYNLETPLDLWNLEWSYEDLKKYLMPFDFMTFQFKISTSEGVIPSKFIMQYKVRIKSKGLIWIIHKYDKDPFPSNPHAHQINNNIKLDLGNGKCYKSKRYIYTIPKKDLIKIRTDASQVYKGDLPILEL